MKKALIIYSTSEKGCQRRKTENGEKGELTNWLSGSFDEEYTFEFENNKPESVTDEVAALKHFWKNSLFLKVAFTGGNVALNSFSIKSITITE